MVTAMNGSDCLFVSPGYVAMIYYMLKLHMVMTNGLTGTLHHSTFGH